VNFSPPPYDHIPSRENSVFLQSSSSKSPFFDSLLETLLFFTHEIVLDTTSLFLRSLRQVFLTANFPPTKIYYSFSL